MDTIFSDSLISLRELALLIFAVLLLAATPGTPLLTENMPQPVNVTVPADDETTPTLNAA